ncbi:MAG: NADH-quinone oxidoreductase subunit N [Alphaproteobacteria bacterium]|nr:NADH-quinone oxidoreductase subunit N [Alphaproteobacteria bacterium]
MNPIFFLPELVLGIGLLAIVLVGTLLSARRAFNLVTGMSLIVFLVAFLAVIGQLTAGIEYEDTFFKVDTLSLFAKAIAMAACVVATLFLPKYFENNPDKQFEIPILMIFVAIGLCVMASANHMLMVFLGLELQSLPIYVLVTLERKRLESSEAGLKYFVLGAVSSGFVVYGASLIYGATGVLGFAEIARVLENGSANNLMVVGVVMLICGIAFKISAAPFHMWTPDVYEGAPTPVTAFMASAPKFVVVVMLLRILNDPLATMLPEWQQVISLLALVSLAVGTLGAMQQDSVKRFIAYSSIGHVGFVLIGVAAGQGGIASVLLYSTIYLVTTFAMFAVILMLKDPKSKSDYVTKLAELIGLAKKDQTIAIIILGIMFSMAGVPPLAGFFAKLSIFQAALQADLLWLVIVGVVFSVISAFYYLRIIRRMYFADEPTSGSIDETLLARAIVSRSTTLILIAAIGFFAIATFAVWGAVLFEQANWASHAF